MSAEPSGRELSALEEALRRALQVASRERVLQMVAVALPQQAEAAAQPGLHGKVEKVSVSMPSELAEAVRSRTGSGGFSRYVSEAVQRQIQLDLLNDLSAELAAEYGPVDDELVRQAMAEWPDYPHK
jgi:Arc/MetJ-type ribon-helix-helix transcriptional regulator